MAISSISKIVKCANCGVNNRIDQARLSSGEAVCGKCKSTLAVDTKPLVITDANFQADVERSPLPVLVDFWAAWCGPCRMIAPAIEQLAEEYAGRARVCKLDVDANQQTAGRFGVQSIPMLIIFKGGKEVDRLVGLQTKEALAARLNRFV